MIGADDELIVCVINVKDSTFLASAGGIPYYPIGFLNGSLYPHMSAK